MTERPVVLIDSREQRPLKFSDAVDVEVAGLPAGDYSLRGYTELVAIERKSLQDLAHCCGADRARFKEQIARLANYAIRAVVIEASLEAVMWGRYQSRIRPVSVIGTLLSVAHYHGVPVWFAGSSENAAMLVERLMLMVIRKAAEETSAP